jgi:hypothetical protein
MAEEAIGTFPFSFLWAPQKWAWDCFEMGSLVSAHSSPVISAISFRWIEFTRAANFPSIKRWPLWNFCEYIWGASPSLSPCWPASSCSDG